MWLGSSSPLCILGPGHPSALGWHAAKVKSMCFGARSLALLPGVSNSMTLYVLKSFSHVRLCDPVDYSPPGSLVYGLLQARILEWVATLSFSRGSSQPRDLTRISCVSCTAGRFFTTEPPGEVQCDLGQAILPPCALVPTSVNESAFSAEAL